MRRGSWGAALALSVGVWAASAGGARASCDQLRADIVTMDATSSGEPGYLALRAELSALYDKLCRGGTGRVGEWTRASRPALAAESPRLSLT